MSEVEVQLQKQSMADRNQQLKLMNTSSNEAAVLAESQLGQQFLPAYNEAVKQLDQDMRLKDALENIDWSLFAKGTFDFEYVHHLLETELPPSDLIARGQQPQYEEMTKVVAALTKTIDDNRSNLGNFHAVFEATKAQLAELEAKFQGTQVNIDDMRHEPFHEALVTFNKVIGRSVEHICEEINLKLADRTTAYQTILDDQLAKYDEEATLVANTAPCRLRASRPEDNEDPWEVRREKADVQFESPHLQQYFEQERQDRVLEDYEDEWYAGRRKDVDSVVPRAKRVVKETDEHQFFECAAILDEMLALAEQKSTVVNAQAADTSNDSAQMLAELRERIARVVAAGEEFQALRADQRARSERDIVRVDKYVVDETQNNKKLIAQFEQDQASDMATYTDIGDAMEKVREEIAAKQRQLHEYATARSDLSKQMVTRLEEEQQRKSKFHELMAICDEYKGLLETSMQNFILADGYNTVLSECLENSNKIAEDVFERQQSMLGSFLNQSVTTFADVSSSLYHHYQQMIHRKSSKFKDLDMKAEMSRKQREFCHSTSDPHTQLHESREDEIIALSNDLKQQVLALEEKRNTAFDQFTKIQPLCEQLQIRIGMTAIVDLPTRCANTQHMNDAFICKAARPPLTNLAFSEEERLSVPPVWYADEQPQRAREVKESQDSIAQRGA